MLVSPMAGPMLPLLFEEGRHRRTRRLHEVPAREIGSHCGRRALFEMHADQDPKKQDYEEQEGRYRVLHGDPFTPAGR